SKRAHTSSAPWQGQLCKKRRHTHTRTLALRLQQAQQTAMMLSERLEMHPLVTRVRYPGLPSHPTHATARRVLKGFGTIISFDLLGGAEIADAVCRNVQLIRHATSLGQ